MNATIQCLSHTDLLAEYLVNGYYKIDLKKRNRLSSKITGSRGELTESFVDLLRSLWHCKYHPDYSFKFKQLVAKHGAQYEGNDQHDAQEFLLWLLDKVHEDLNISERKKSKKPKVSSRLKRFNCTYNLMHRFNCPASLTPFFFALLPPVYSLGDY